MALEEKRNNVKFQGRDDYSVVYYDVLETGKKYFFLDEGKERLNNGNVIATTSLKVAINASTPEETVEIGVISPEGVEVIPFNHRKIKKVDDNTLLAEISTPVSENVIKAAADRNQPQEATRLVGAANTIKEKINNSMGPEGSFIFNDLFSEATIYDIDGNNLVDGQYFSFIGKNNDSLFLSTNDPEFEPISIELKKEEVMPEAAVTEGVVTPEVAPATNEENNIDVSEVKVEENVVDDAFNNEVAENIEAVEPIANEVEAATEEVMPEETVEDTQSVETLDDTAVESIVEPVTEEQSTDTLEDTVEESVVEPIAEEKSVEESVENVSVPEDVSVPIAESTEEVVEVPAAEEISPEEVMAELNYNYNPEDEKEVELNLQAMDEDNDLDSDRLQDYEVKVDSIDRRDSFDNLVEESGYRETDMAEGTIIIQRLINTVKEQSSKIDQLESSLAEQKDINRSAVRKVKEQEDRIGALSTENNKLEEQNNYLDRVATTLAAQNDELKNKVKDNDKFLEQLRIAKEVLDGRYESKYDFGQEEPRYSFDDRNIYRRIS
ncbi:MAG: hypothetical protein IKE63_06330 [Bacilli bacterium]|nr:hypothetical protein [Bacilli bacterium]